MRKTIETGLIVWGIIFLLTSCATINKYPTYQEALSSWPSHEDVATWLTRKFIYSYKRARQEGGTAARKPNNLYQNPKGHCLDAAYFAQRTLNKINPEYKAKLIFILNKGKGLNHFATGFYINGDIFVMDYGTGYNWASMQGVHGPYKSLYEYHRFLSSLQIQGFRVGSVSWNEGYSFSED